MKISKARNVSRLSSGQNVHRIVKQMLESRLEHKRITATGALADLSASGVVNSISVAVAQGDDISQRSGDLIRPRSLRVKYEFVNSQNALGYSYLNRLIVFRDNMATGSTPAVTDVLASANPISGYNSVNAQQKRFIVLFDKTMPVISFTTDQLVSGTVNIPLNGIIHYLGTTAVAASQGKGSLFALFISSATAAGFNQYAWSYEFVYTDA